MRHTTPTSPPLTIGMDLGDFKTVVAELDSDHEVSVATIPTTPDAMREHFGRIPRGPTVYFEVGSCSRWVKEVLQGLGHDVHVADPRIVPKPGRKKSDKVDATHLARLGFADPKLLGRVHHRSRSAQIVMAHLRSRFALVEARTKLTNATRGVLKSFGIRMPRCTTKTVHAAVPQVEGLPPEVLAAVTPLLKTCGQLTGQIKELDAKLAQIARTEYPETDHLRQIHGVGPLTALYFVLLVEDPGRFRRNRDIGGYLGLAPALRESGTIQPQLRISKAGDRTMRCLLVGAAQCIMRSTAPPSDLKRHGQAIALRGGGNGKKRGVVAVARKLAILMLSMWKSREDWEPNRHEPVVEDGFMGKPRVSPA